MFYSLMEKGMLKNIKIAGLAFTITNKYTTWGQPKVIAKFDNKSSYIKQLLRISGI